MWKLGLIAFLLGFSVAVGGARAQTPGGERAINVEGSLRGDRDAGHRGEPGGRGEGGGSRGSSSSSPPTSSVTMPTLQIPYDVGAPPLPPQGFQSHKVQYADGSYDLVRVHEREGTYTIDHHNAAGTRVGGESGSVAGYRGGTYNPMMFVPPPPVWTCYTPAGPIRVNNAMTAGERCIAMIPHGTFYGTAGSP